MKDEARLGCAGTLVGCVRNLMKFDEILKFLNLGGNSALWL